MSAYPYSRKAVIDTAGCCLRVMWCIRGDSAETDQHAVHHTSMAHEYCKSLRQEAEKLTSRLGWAWQDWHPAEIEVRVFDFGPGQTGAAIIDLKNVPYLRLSCRRFSSDDAIEGRRLGNVVLHELVHLLQFGTDVWWSWPNAGAIGEDDPNNWLHESVALAVEAFAGDGPADWYPWLWKWAVEPHKSWDQDPSGVRAAPFLMFLSDQFGADFPALLYTDNTRINSPRYGVEIVDDAIQKKRANRSLGSEFARYCAAWLSPDRLWSEQAIAIRNVVGDRAISEVGDVGASAKTTWHSQTWSVDHLGCRYFEVRGLGNSDSMSYAVDVIPEREDCSEELVAMGVVVNEAGEVMSESEFIRTAAGLTARVPQCEDGEVLRLVIVNTAFGPGWALHDDFPFHLEFHHDR